MPEIGATLRDTRLRRRLDITEVEAQTKIRAKYLRALEEEEWDVLPGPTFVKTFLRTYAEYLDLDARSLVEEYRRRYERPSTADLTPFGPGLGGRRDRRRVRLLSPGIVLALGVVALLAALYLLGTWGEDTDGDPPAPPPGTEQRTSDEHEAAREARRERRRRAARRERERERPERVSVTVVATGTVYVCLVDATGAERVDGETLTAGQRRGPFRSGRVRVTLGNGAAYLRVSGRRVEVPERSVPVSYDLRPGRSPRELPAGSGPTCA